MDNAEKKKETEVARLVCIFLGLIGLKPNEIGQLKWGSIPREHDRIKRLPNGGVFLKLTKSKGGYHNTKPDSSIFIPPTFVDVLDELLEDTGRGVIEVASDNAYVFCQGNGPKAD